MSTLLDRLVDDAAIFPPGKAPLDVAIRDHQRHRSGAYAALIGPLLVRDSDVPRVGELAEGRPELGIVATAGPAGLGQAVAEVADLPHVSLVAVEIMVPSGELLPATEELVAALAWVPPDVTVSVELPRPGGSVSSAWIAAADEIAAAGFQAKFRTGGEESAAHPDEVELAAVLGTLVRHRFKLTAGLHRAVRNTQPGTGFEQHGFLNVLVAVHGLLAGATLAETAGVLAERDGRALAAIARSWSAADAVAVRRTFRGFGSCSLTEPGQDLVELGLR